jgi:hypothetical protein
MMAARGMIPLGPADLLTVLYVLSFDPDANVAASAKEKCTSLPPGIMEGALKVALDARVLDFYADKVQHDDALMEIILLNHATADETVARNAKRVNEHLCEIVATNEQRLLRSPEIIEGLYHNRSARMSTVNRAVELAVRNNIQLTGIAAFKEVAAAIQGELIIEADVEQVALPSDVFFMDSLRIGDALEQEIGAEGVEAELDGEAPSSMQRESLESEISKMSNAEKVRLALLGNASHRALLVRDANKMVALAAIKAPAVKDTEVVAYSRNKALCEDVVRFIAYEKDWTKLYQVKMNLVENPKTPLPRALSFLSHLRANDLKTISRSKNVPAAVAQAAANYLKRRQI